MKGKDFSWLAYLQRLAGVSGAQPCLLNTGIIAEFVVSRYVAGESVAAIAEDYFLSPTLVEAAIRLCLLVNGTGLDSKRARRRLDALVPVREPYRVSQSGGRGRSSRRRSRRLTTRA